MVSFSSLSVEELVRECSTSPNAEAWEEFVRRFHRLIATVILRTASRLGDSSKQKVDDLIQETYLKLCADKFRILRIFEQQHPDAFTGYIKVVTANVVRDHFKASFTKKRGAGHLEQMDDDLVPAAGQDSDGSAKSIERTLLIQEITGHVNICLAGPDQERNQRIFWLHYRAGLSARAISELPGIDLTTKGVESIILRVIKELRKRMTKPKAAGAAENQAGGEGILPAESF